MLTRVRALACVASVSEGAKNGGSAFCPREKWGESKNRKGGWGSIYRPVILCANPPYSYGWSKCSGAPAWNAKVAPTRQKLSGEQFAGVRPSLLISRFEVIKITKPLRAISLVDRCV